MDVKTFELNEPMQKNHRLIDLHFQGISKQENNLLILGAGRHGRVLKETAEAMDYLHKIDFLDDNPDKDVAIGLCKDFKCYIESYNYAIPAIGNNELRLKWLNELVGEGFRIPTVIHRTAYVSPSAKIAEGVFIGANAVVNTNVVIEKGSIIGIGALIDHDSTIGECSHVDCGAIVKVGCIVERLVKVKPGKVYTIKNDILKRIQNVIKNCINSISFVRIISKSYYCLSKCINEIKYIKIKSNVQDTANKLIYFIRTNNTKNKLITALKRYSNYRMLKRFFDLIISFTGLILLSPLLIIVAIAVKLESKGSIIFKQNRLGVNGKAFKIYKFRSMFIGAEKSGVYETKGDIRVTKVGKLIRKTSIDELPQLINIVKGEMSIIGPRPVLTYHPWPFIEYTNEQKKRFNVKPGITGWAQINGRKDISWNKRIKYDIEYVENLTLCLDFKIFIKTVIKVITMKDNVNIRETV